MPPLFERAATAVRASEEPACKAFLAAYPAGGAPAGNKREILVAVDDFLRRVAPAEWTGLMDFKRTCDQQFRNLFAALGQAFGRDKMVLVAAASRGGLLDGDSAPQVHADRYLKLLGVLLERVVCLLRGEGALHQVRVRVAARGLDKALQPAAGPVSIRRDHVQQCIDAALQFPWLQKERASVAFEALRPEEFDGGVHPGVVLADFVSNKFFALSNSKSWAELEAGVTRSFTLPADARCGAVDQRLPAVAAAGETRIALVRALTGEAPARSLGSGGWEQDQAARWLAAAATLTGGTR